jgi:hypothetical protein
MTEVSGVASTIPELRTKGRAALYLTVVSVYL